MIQFALLTIPTPEPYDDKDPQRQTENFFYALNQILAQLKANSETKDVNPTFTANLDVTELTQAVKDLMYNGQELSVPLPDGPELTLKFTSRSLSLVTV